MEQTQNTNTPPEPKKSFWAKLFGGGKASAPAPTPQIDLSDIGLPSADPSASTPANSTSSNNFSSMPSTPAASPSGWNADSVEAPATNPTVEPVAASWQEKPAASDVPVPPSDPMVTPVEQPAVEVPAPAAPAEEWTPAAQAPAAPAPEHDDEVGGDRPSITPPSR